MTLLPARDAAAILHVSEAYVRLRLVPVSLSEARRYVAEVHRHNDPPIAHRASVGIADEQGTLRGVGILGIPKARLSMDGRTVEVVRVATDGVKNGCSMLYGALVRVAWNLGYDRVLTYTLDSEPGTSLKAAGWRREGIVESGGKQEWNRRNGRELRGMFYEPKVPDGPKVKWVIERKAA